MQFSNSTQEDTALFACNNWTGGHFMLTYFGCRKFKDSLIIWENLHEMQDQIITLSHTELLSFLNDIQTGMMRESLNLCHPITVSMSFWPPHPIVAKIGIKLPAVRKS